MVGQRLLRVATCALLGLSGVVAGTPAHAGDPRLLWHTIETEGFRIHFHAGLEHVAQRAAHLAPQIEAQLIRLVGARERITTDIVLTDNSESANGFASALPYAHVQLYVTAPDDMSALGEHDDWLSTLMIHEGTHIVHVSQVAGLPALYNAVLGRQLAPISLQPSWLKEGLAVYAESTLTGGGRLRSSMFEMMIRADVVDGTFATLDQISADPIRWPAGIQYLYGGKFVEFIANLYGPSVFATVTQDSSDDVIPYAVSRPFYRATGRTVEQLYSAFQMSTQRRIDEQLASVEARGRREGRRLTTHGRSLGYPRYVLPHCRRGHSTADRERPKSAALLYFRSNGHERSGYYELGLEPTGADANTSDILVSRSSGEHAALGPDCSIWFESIAVSRRRYGFSDLFRQLPETTAPSGLEPSRQRLTVGRRATAPDVSADASQIVYITNRAGTTTLRIAKLDGMGQPSEERVLVPSATYEQVFTPRFSPDGKRVVFGVWTRGGFRDLRIVDLATGLVSQPWRDRAVDQQPVFSPDGNWLYFSSDRSGIPNIYAYELKSGKLWQVTNVRTGAFMPELSPDQKQLYYVGYSSRGYDLYAMELVERQFLPAVAEPAARDDKATLTDTGAHPIRPYNALTTLRPRAVDLNYQTEASGQRLTLTTRASDIAGLHSVKATMIFEPEGASPDVYLNYDYRRLPIDFYARVQRKVDPNRSYRYGTYREPVDEIRTGATTGIGIPFPAEFESQYASFEYSAEQVSSVLPTGLAADPFATVPSEPRRGVSSSLRAAYQYSNVESTALGVGDERGLRCYVSVQGAHRALGSELEGSRAEGRVTGYLPMPWARHHVLALSGYAGASTGNAFYGFTFGGYRDPEFWRNLTLGIGQGRLPLRGYPSDRFWGDRMVLGQSEYRFPLALIDRGQSTLPVFLRRVAGAVSFDVGSAFTQFDPHRFDQSLHYSFAAELWLDFVFGYAMGSRLVIGYAVGMGEGAYPGGTSYLAVGSRL